MGMDPFPLGREHSSARRTVHIVSSPLEHVRWRGPTPHIVLETAQRVMGKDNLYLASLPARHVKCDATLGLCRLGVENPRGVSSGR
jgi:hypothetical protein